MLKGVKSSIVSNQQLKWTLVNLSHHHMIKIFTISLRVAS